MKLEISDQQRDFVLKVESLGKRYVSASHGRWALRDVSFLVEPGGALAVTGPNGSGKSTLLRLLAGVMYPTEGRVSGRGRMISMHAIHLPLSPTLSLRDAVKAQAAFWGVPRSEALASLDEVLDWCEISMKPDEKLYKLSDGMVRRLAFASAVFLKPRLILADGNLGVGDAAFQERCLDHIEAMIADGCALVLATHRQSLVKRLCKHVLVLQDGRVLERRTFNLSGPAVACEDGADDGGDAEDDGEAGNDGQGEGGGGTFGVMALSALMLEEHSIPFCDADVSPAFEFTAHVRLGHGSRFKADFFCGRDLAFRVVSPELTSSRDQIRMRLDMPSLTLIPGQWRCEVSLASDEGRRRLVKFQVDEARPERSPPGSWRGRLPGCVTPGVEWDLVRPMNLGPDEAACLFSNVNGALHAVNVLPGPVLLTSAPISVALDFSVFVSGLDARCCVDFLFRDQRAFRAIMPLPKRVDPGRWRATLTLHPDQLAEGEYTLNAVVVFPESNGPAPLVLYAAARFRTEADTAAGVRVGWRGPMPGVVMPRSSWTLMDSGLG